MRVAAAAAGFALLASVALLFVVSLYAMVVSKFMPETGHFALDWLRRDYFYSYLIPCTLVVSIVSVYANWYGLKLFRHN